MLDGVLASVPKIQPLSPPAGSPACESGSHTLLNAFVRAPMPDSWDVGLFCNVVTFSRVSEWPPNAWMMMRFYQFLSSPAGVDICEKAGISARPAAALQSFSCIRDACHRRTVLSVAMGIA